MFTDLAHQWSCHRQLSPLVSVDLSTAVTAVRRSGRTSLQGLPQSPTYIPAGRISDNRPHVRADPQKTNRSEEQDDHPRRTGLTTIILVWVADIGRHSNRVL